MRDELTRLHDVFRIPGQSHAGRRRRRLQTYMSMDVLTDAEKRGMLHDNAVRLLRLDESAVR